MANRISALDGHNLPRRFGMDGDVQVTLSNVPDLELQQVSAWPDSLDRVGQVAATTIGVTNVAAPCRAEAGDRGAMLRIEPLKWWMVDAGSVELNDTDGATLDLSHSRTRVRISGDQATTLLNRLLPIDLREQSFPVNSVASSFIHHVGVTLWRSAQGYELFIPRGFALATWEILIETAEQFAAEIQ